MGLRQRIISEIYDEKDNKVVDRQIIIDKEIPKPKKIDEVGHDQKEQIEILQKIQDAFLLTQTSMMAPEKCPTCGSRVVREGYAPTDFHAVYTDHRLKIAKMKCCNKECEKQRITTTIYSLFGSSMHPDLVKKQAEAASQQSYRQAQKSLEREDGRYRTINNQQTIKKTIEAIGDILNNIHCSDITEEEDPSRELIAQVDGGFVKSNDNNRRSFEVLVSTVYKPEDCQSRGYSKNGLRKSGVITGKIYSASALKDRGKTIREMLIASAKRKGMTNKSHIVGISDGASNCWNTLKVLEKHCKSIEYVLDWYHIKQKFEALINKLEDRYRGEIESIQWKIWHGESEEGIERLGRVYIELLKCDEADKVHELLKYLMNNKEYLKNYAQRKEGGLVYTSSVIESTIETLVNTRHKKKHKAQWSREGAHNILQIRASIANKKWDDDWRTAQSLFYKSAA